MTAVSSAIAERSRKAHSLALQRLASVGQAEVARVLDTSESTISRAVNADLEKVCQILAAVGLKVVPMEMQCFPPRKVQMLLDLARDHLNAMETPEQLQWD